MHDRLFRRSQKKAKKGMRGWPVATIAFYGPDLSRASKVAVGVIPHESASPQEMRAWTLETGDVRSGTGVIDLARSLRPREPAREPSREPGHTLFSSKLIPGPWE